MEKLRVLFVDDEPAILDSIRDLLRKDRKRWDLEFAVGGADALDLLKARPWDVVITDMRMPGMDGAELLREVRKLHPNATRVVLSGHATIEAVSRSLPLAHQYLAKPCDRAALRGLLESIEDLIAVMSNPELRRVAGGMSALPAAPTTYFELTVAATDSSKGTADLAAILERDPAMSVKVLQVVNSAYFGLGRKVSTVQQATSHLGIETLKGLTLAQSVFGSGDKKANSVRRQQERALATATLARTFLNDPSEQGDAFTAGIIHDVGSLVLAQTFPEKHRSLSKSWKTDALPPEVERAEWGVSHAEVGAYVLGSWGLPPHLVATTAFHHTPSKCSSAATSERVARILAALHVADVLVEGGNEDFDLEHLRHACVLEDLETWKASGAKFLSNLGKG